MEYCQWHPYVHSYGLGSSLYYPLVYYFTANGNINWPINYEVAAGDYELIIESLSAQWGRDRDDISWDDIVLDFPGNAVS